MSAKKRTAKDAPPEGYFFQSAQPFPSLIFTLPLLLTYEGAILALGPDAVHTGAAVWLQNFLGLFGLGQFVLLPAVTIALLIGWHYMLRLSWKFPPWTLAGMLVESVAYAALLWIIFRGYCAVTGVAGGVPPDAAQLLGFFGAGIYEELLFRVLLLSGIALLMQTAGAQRRASVITAIAVSAVIFAAAHYNTFVSGGIDFAWDRFAFHTFVGAYLGTVFTLRGFGITAGAHALYDIAVMVVNV